MKKYLFLGLLILIYIFPSNASADSKTKSQVLSYLTSLKSQPSKKVLSGQRTGWLNDGTNGQDMYGNDIFADIARNSGGYAPAIMGADIDKYNNGNAPYDLTRLIDHWNAGGLVELDWIAANPYNNVYEWPPNDPEIDIADVYTPGNTIYNNFRAHMDYVASALKSLQESDVVVLFRPFPEMNSACPTQLGGYTAWGWWGGQNTTKFKNMWIYLHNYLTVTKGLTNIIWVYGPQGGFWRCETDYYPGTSYVDIVGISYYAIDGRFSYIPQYDTLSTLGKPFAFSELGQCDGGANWASCGGKDTRYISQNIKANFPNTVYWMNWDDQWELGQQANLPKLFTDPWVVNRADKPSGGTSVQTKKPSNPVGFSIR